MRPRRACGPFARPRGAAVAVVLILLVVMTLIALASLRGTLLEERMTANMADRSAAFQAAEAALRQGEVTASGKPSPSTSAGCDSNGICVYDPSATPVWKVSANWDSKAPTASSGAKYLIEKLADNVPPAGSCTTSGDVSETSCSGSESRYRITALSAGNGRSRVMLQSVYSVP